MRLLKSLNLALCILKYIPVTVRTPPQSLDLLFIQESATSDLVPLDIQVLAFFFYACCHKAPTLALLYAIHRLFRE